MEMCWTAASELGPLSWMSPMWRDVEDADAGAHGHVLGDEAGVFDRHVPAAEVDHLGAEAAVGGVQCGLAECGRREAAVVDTVQESFGEGWRTH